MMNNSPHSVDRMILAMVRRRWPHDHWFFLWMASVVGMLSCFLHLSVPWMTGGASWLAKLALLMLPGAIFLWALAPSHQTASWYRMSLSYRICRILRRVLSVVAVLGGGVAWVAEHAWGLAWSLVLFCLVWWITELQARVIRIHGDTWYLGFPISIQHDTQSEEEIDSFEESDMLGLPLARGVWRVWLFFGLWLGWTVIVWQANHGGSAKLPGIGSWATWVLWWLGGWVCLGLSRWPPTWGVPRGRVLWRDDSVVCSLFVWSSLPGCVLTVILAAYHIGYQLWFVSPLDFSYTVLVYDLCLWFAALVLLSDPSGIFTWIVKPASRSGAVQQFWVRRHGWIETFPGGLS